MQKQNPNIQHYLRRRIRSFMYAFAGLRHLVQTQPNARIHVVATTAVIVAGIYFRVSRLEWCLLIISIVSVLAAETFNTALERLTDLVSPNYHLLAGQTKDLAAAAVLLTALGAVAVGLLIFLPKII
jgi:diacylglycerol kinase (ATP)